MCEKVSACTVGGVVIDAYIRSGSTATGGLFPIVRIWMRVRMRIRVAQLDIVCRTRVHGKNSRSCALYQCQYEHDVVLCLHKGSGAVSYLSRQLARRGLMLPGTLQIWFAPTALA